MNMNKIISKEENIRRCHKWAEYHRVQGNKAGELLWLKRITEWNQDEVRGEEPYPPIMVKLEGRPRRDAAINSDDILNLKIQLGLNQIPE